MRHKIALIGTGMVGMSFAYAATIQGLCKELVLIDIDSERAKGEAYDLQHAIPFLNVATRIYSGGYELCQDADIAIIPAGAPQLPGETRLELVEKNAKIMRSIIKPLIASGFDGIIIVASNPVDIMTYVAMKESGLPTHRVFGSGTYLDSGRLRHNLAELFKVSPNSIHSYIIGEHGDSSLPTFSAANVAGKPLFELAEEKKIPKEDLEHAYSFARDAAYEIIRRKKATYYGIGAALARIVKSIMSDECNVIPLSAYLTGQYGQKDLYIGVPAVATRNGIREIIEVPLSEEEKLKFDHSC
jgi:L-lactate dehydrogenase